MASIAEQMLASGLKSSAESGPDLAGNFTKGIQQGAALAQQVENIQIEREKMEEAKQRLKMDKIGRLTTAMENGAKIPSKAMRSSFFKNYIPKMQTALGLQDLIPEDTMAMIQADPEQAKKISLLKTKIMNGAMTYDQAIAKLDPEEFAMMDDKEIVQLEAAEKFRVSQANTTQRANVVGGRQDAHFDTNQYQKVKDDFDASTKDSLAGLTAADSARKLLDSGGPIAAETVKTQLARLTGEKGPLTDADIARFGGSRDLLSRAEQFMTKQSTGNLTPETRKEYKQIMSEFRSVLAAKIQDQEGRAIESAQGLGLDPNRAKKVLAADRLLRAPAPSKDKAPAQDWKKILESKKEGFLKLTGPEKDKFVEGMSKRLKVEADQIREQLGGETKKAKRGMVE